MKNCPKCGRNRLLKSFYFRKTGPRKGEHYEKCKDCMKFRGRNYYQENKQRQLPLALIRRSKYRAKAREYLIKLKDRDCQDCGHKFPACAMDFDHRDKKHKIRDIARMVAGGWAFDKIQKEIKKCDLVCANCHRVRTYNRQHAEVVKVVTTGL